MKLIVTILFALSMTVWAQNPGDIIITEVMQNPSAVGDADGEWFEIFNTTAGDIDINGWTISDNDFDSHVIANGGPLVVPANDFLVLARNSDTGVNGDYTSAYQYGDDIALANGADELILTTAGAVEMDRIEYDGGAVWPDPTGASMALSNFTADNNDGVNWTTATQREQTYVGATGDLGSPGTLGSDANLPVSLEAFRASAGNSRVILLWATASEVGNLGFEVWRSTELHGDYIEISSYQNNSQLVGQINSSDRTAYRFEDHLVVNGTTYYYRLLDVDVSGARHVHGPRSATPQAAVGDVINLDSNAPQVFSLQQNYPNPFNPGTKIPFDIPSITEELAPLTIEIYNTLGQRVRVLYNGQVSPGSYEVEWDGKSETGVEAPAGIYIVTMNSTQIQKNIKIALLK